MNPAAAVGDTHELPAWKSIHRCRVALAPTSNSSADLVVHPSAPGERSDSGDAGFPLTVRAPSATYADALIN